MTQRDIANIRDKFGLGETQNYHIKNKRKHNLVHIYHIEYFGRFATYAGQISQMKEN